MGIEIYRISKLEFLVKDDQNKWDIYLNYTYITGVGNKNISDILNDKYIIPINEVILLKYEEINRKLPYE